MTIFTQIKQVSESFEDGNWIESKDQSSAGIRLIQTGNIKSGYFENKINKARYISEKTFNKLNCKEVFEGDILISRLPDPVGRGCIVPKLENRSITAVDCTIIRVNKKLINDKYFLYYLQSPQYQFLVNQKVTGTTRSRISRTNLGEINIPVPPLQEQEKIVERLDKVFKNIDKSTKIIENNIQNIQMIYSSSLNKNTEKDLSNEFSLGDLCEVVTKGTTPTSVGHKFIEGGINFIKIECINSSGEFLHNKFSYINEECHETLKRSKLAEGDILFSIAGALGRTALVTNDILPANTNQALAIIRLKKNIKINADYLIYVLNSKLVENQSNKFMAGVAQQNLSLTQ
ncbi:restriction endonuclease subunit S, partial [Acidimicrobiia bacterium]|nr:restriction endonuclease subunit S [Acidimicrobiia bacterium]